MCDFYYSAGNNYVKIFRSLLTIIIHSVASLPIRANGGESSWRSIKLKAVERYGEGTLEARISEDQP